ncbi:hypothetical protein M947_03880 [Sulfurimonas hongkongensis]|uniref:Uncharacterized protein n=1 Tax=Sulfurimonas hongkongensis TaxID=1172190 RepID=T0JTB3_9BACT|nr:hypothetical protein [Sulfurimonas hongkongensis]EQB40172.1 hypothetical protein M947_03880 [Sulfurimonas hongkongensis]
MARFYFFLWLRWAVRLTLCSVAFAALFSFVVTFYIYVSQGMSALDRYIIQALLEVFIFWFALFLNATLLLALFRGMKYLFNTCIYGYKLTLLSCDAKEELKAIGYGDLLRVWRKWFMLMIWLVGSFMIISLVFTYLFSTYSGVFEWFNIYWLYLFILASGYISFIFMSARCKRVKVSRC